MFYSIHIFRQH